MVGQKGLIFLSLAIFATTYCEASFLYYLRNVQPDPTFCATKTAGKIYCNGCRARIYCEATDKGWPETCAKDLYCLDEKDGVKDTGFAECQKNEVDCGPREPPANLGGAPICNRVGRFPDPQVCDGYWECIEVSPANAAAGSEKKGTFYSCPEGAQFDAKKGSCQAIAANQCVDLSLKNNSCSLPGAGFKKVAHPLNPNFYVFCKPGYMTIEMCASPYQYFSFKEQKCTFKCQQDGLFGDPNKFDTAKGFKGFINCVKVGTTFKLDKSDCPEGAFFDETIQYCKK